MVGSGFFIFHCLLIFHGIEHISQTTLSAVLTIKVGSHEDTSSTLLGRAFASQSVNFAIIIHTVVFQYCQFDLLVLMLDLFGCGVILLLTLLATTTKTEDQVKGRLFLDVVVTQSTTILKLFAGKNQTLLVWRDTLFVLDLGLDIFNSI